MSENTIAIGKLADIATSAKFGIRFAEQATDRNPDFWEGWAAAMRTVDEHATRLLEELHQENAERGASEIVSNVVDLAGRRRT